MATSTQTTGTQSASDASRAASDIKDAAGAQAGQLKDAATEHAGELVGEMKEQARQVTDDARDEIQRQLDQQGRRLGESLGGASRQLHSMAEAGEPGLVQDLTGQLADRLGRVADTVDRGGVQAVAEDLRRFARRQPGVFLVGAIAVGFVGARLLRAGASSRSDGDRSGGTLSGATGAAARPVNPASGSVPAAAPTGELGAVPAVEIPVGAVAPEGLVP
ncbi:MAG TPA: hypothetical protein VGN59_08020 [Acidimicrobiia bacterium]|jgi:uncharacterized protein YjbJ (UPF0337 family)